MRSMENQGLRNLLISPVGCCSVLTRHRFKVAWAVWLSKSQATVASQPRTGAYMGHNRKHNNSPQLASPTF